MSALFRGKFLDYLKRSYESGDLIFPGVIGHLKEPRVFERFRRQFYHNIKTLSGPEGKDREGGLNRHRVRSGFVLHASI
jgi:hypothetical protein